MNEDLTINGFVNGFNDEDGYGDGNGFWDGDGYGFGNGFASGFGPLNNELVENEPQI